MIYKCQYSDGEGTYRAEIQAESIDGLVCIVKKLNESIAEFQKNENEQFQITQDQLNQAKIYFPGEKFCDPKGKDYGIGDFVKLAARKQDGDTLRLLQKWGSWWKVRAAIKHGAAWIITTIADQPRENSKKLVTEEVMMKDMDERFAVIGVYKFPATFNYKTAELGARVNA